MEKYLLSIFFACLFCSAGFVQSRGLFSSSYEEELGRQTSSGRIPEVPVCTGQGINMPFGAIFRPGMGTYSALRVATKRGQIIDLVHNRQPGGMHFVAGRYFTTGFRAGIMLFHHAWRCFGMQLTGRVTRYLKTSVTLNANAPNALSNPSPPAAVAPAPRQIRLDRVLMGLACMLTAGALFFFVWKHWHTFDEAHGPSPAVPPETPRSSAAIFLFGDFKLTDKNGNDCTHLFTPLPKELFLLLLIYTAKDGKGIATEELFKLLWGNKSPQDAQKDFSASLIELKTILEKAGGLHIIEEAGRWKLEVPADVRFDYRDYLQQPTSATIQKITARGSFLQHVTYEWLDNIKSEISRRANR